METVKRSVLAKDLGREERTERWIGREQWTFRAVKLLCMMP